MTRWTLGLSLVVATSVALSAAEAAGLKGSMTSMRRQHAAAKEAELDFLRTAKQVAGAVEAGALDTIAGNADYRTHQVSFPYARPEVRELIERIAAEYRAATGARLVVTSLTRPSALQPSNAHRLSVHPAGMAVDFRVPADSAARAWLERELLRLEEARVLDVTREVHPPHYHVAVFPQAFRAYAAAHPSTKPSPPTAAAAPAPVLPVAAPVVVLAADAGAGFGAWGLLGVLGVIVAGGSAARRRVRVRAHRD